ncbi:MAG: hypothetical protein ACR2LO_02425 [Ilumatobacteraceae bacterium]
MRLYRFGPRRVSLKGQVAREAPATIRRLRNSRVSAANEASQSRGRQLVRPEDERTSWYAWAMARPSTSASPCSSLSFVSCSIRWLARRRASAPGASQ